MCDARELLCGSVSGRCEGTCLLLCIHVRCDVVQYVYALYAIGKQILYARPNNRGGACLFALVALLILTTDVQAA